jgi:hypothetical protein
MVVDVFILAKLDLFKELLPIITNSIRDLCYQLNIFKDKAFRCITQDIEQADLVWKVRL